MNPFERAFSVLKDLSTEDLRFAARTGGLRPTPERRYRGRSGRLEDAAAHTGGGLMGGRDVSMGSRQAERLDAASHQRTGHGLMGDPIYPDPPRDSDEPLPEADERDIGRISGPPVTEPVTEFNRRTWRDEPTGEMRDTGVRDIRSTRFRRDQMNAPEFQNRETGEWHPGMHSGALPDEEQPPESTGWRVRDKYPHPDEPRDVFNIAREAALEQLSREQEPAEAPLPPPKAQNPQRVRVQRGSSRAPPAPGTPNYAQEMAAWRANQPQRQQRGRRQRRR